MTPATLRTLKAVCDYLSVNINRVCDGSQLPQHVFARDVAMYVVRQFYRPRPSLAEVALDFGRHHNTVVNALVRVEAKRRDKATMAAIEAGHTALCQGHAQGDWLSKWRELEMAKNRVAELEAALYITSEPVAAE